MVFFLRGQSQCGKWSLDWMVWALGLGYGHGRKQRKGHLGKTLLNQVTENKREAGTRDQGRSTTAPRIKNAIFLKLFIIMFAKDSGSNKWQKLLWPESPSDCERINLIVAHCVFLSMNSKCFAPADKIFFQREDNKCFSLKIKNPKRKAILSKT